MAEILVPGVPRHDHLGVDFAVVAWEGDAQLGVAVFLSKLGAVDSWWITAPLGIDEELGLSNVPLDRIQLYRPLKIDISLLVL